MSSHPSGSGDGQQLTGVRERDLLLQHLADALDGRGHGPGEAGRPDRCLDVRALDRHVDLEDGVAEVGDRRAEALDELVRVEVRRHLRLVQADEGAELEPGDLEQRLGVRELVADGREDVGILPGDALFDLRVGGEEIGDSLEERPAVAREVLDVGPADLSGQRRAVDATHDGLLGSEFSTDGCLLGMIL